MSFEIKCEICGKIFNNKKSMTNHRRWHKLPKFAKFQKSCVRKISRSLTGKKNPLWKGDDVGYSGLHNYVRNHLTPSLTCQKCNKTTTKLDVANISGEYKRDLGDWGWLCRKCHMLSDGRLAVFISSRRNKHELY